MVAGAGGLPWRCLAAGACGQGHCRPFPALPSHGRRGTAPAGCARHVLFLQSHRRHPGGCDRARAVPGPAARRGGDRVCRPDGLVPGVPGGALSPGHPGRSRYRHGRGRCDIAGARGHCASLRRPSSERSQRRHGSPGPRGRCGAPSRALGSGPGLEGCEYQRAGALTCAGDGAGQGTPTPPENGLATCVVAAAAPLWKRAGLPSPPEAGPVLAVHSSPDCRGVSGITCPYADQWIGRPGHRGQPRAWAWPSPGNWSAAARPGSTAPRATPARSPNPASQPVALDITNPDQVPAGRRAMRATSACW